MPHVGDSSEHLSLGDLPVLLALTISLACDSSTSDDLLLPARPWDTCQRRLKIDPLSPVEN